MKSIIQTTLFIGILLLTALNARASHYLGGEITWECTGNGQYEFTVIIYKECGSGAANYVSMILHGPPLPGGQVTLTQISVEEVSPDCAGGGSIACNTSASGKGAVQKFTLKKTVTLSGTPPATGWEFWWYDSARPTTSLVNTNSGGYYLRGVMYPYTPVGGTAPLNVNTCYDNSPYFSEVGSLTICEGNPFTYNHLVGDKDLDSLYVRFADPLQSAGVSIAWETGYNSSSPYPSNLTNSANGPIVLDGKTGAVSMDIQTATTGSYASCYEVEAWKCGQTPNGPAPVKVASVFRDVVIVLRDDCDPNPSEPLGTIDTSLYTNIQQLGPKTYTTSVYPGDTIEFEVNAADFDLGPTFLPQQITFTAAGLQVSKPLASGTGCDGIAPCATFAPIAPQAGYVSPQNNNIKFFWVPDCAHLNLGGNYCNPVNTFFFSLRMQDDGCKTPRVALTTFIVNVLPGDPTPINYTCFKVDPPTGDYELGWEKAPVDSGLDFNYYMILAGPNASGSYDTLPRIYDIDSLSTMVDGSLGYTNFYMIKSTGLCDFLSVPSDTLTLMDLTLVATPPGNSEYAQLSWTPLSTPLPYTSNGVYEIWTEAPAGSGNWSKVGETTGLSYTDTVTVCNDSVSYQIRVTDTISGCQSGSTIKGGTFQDKTNSDKMVLDSVSVNNNGNIIISWQSTDYGDVVEYYIYFNDPVLGWVVVDTVPILTPMPYEWTDSQADERSEEFKIVSADSCGNTSDDQVVKAHASIYLRNYLNKCEGYSRLSWNAYEGFGKSGVAGYELLMQTTNSGVTSPWTLLAVAGPNDTTYLQESLQSGYEYCYRVRAIDTSGTKSSRSNELCITAEVPQKSRLLYLAQVTNNLSRGSVEINIFIDGGADVLSFDIERAPDIKGPYEEIGEVQKPATAPFVINFSDYGARSASNHYYYRVTATDSCGGRDTVSNLGRNILLKVTPRANISNVLEWNPYETWNGGVSRYDIYRKGAEETAFSLLVSVPGSDTMYSDKFDLSTYGNTEGNFCYYVVGVEGSNNLGIVMDNGQPYNSRSNNECVNQKARVFIPTAFRPRSEEPLNRTFGPSLKFTEVEEYTFYIMNRWGVKVFETSNPDEQWDGSYNGQDAQSGVYIYYVQYATPGEVPVEERGSFVLIR